MDGLIGDKGERVNNKGGSHWKRHEVKERKKNVFRSWKIGKKENGKKKFRIEMEGKENEGEITLRNTK